MSALRENAAMYLDSIQAKDQIIVSLANRLHQVELDQSQPPVDRSNVAADVPDVRPTQRFISDTRELDELKVRLSRFSHLRRIYVLSYKIA